MARTRGDAEGYGAGLTADVDYVPFDGSRLTGRQAVIDSHDRLFRGVLSGSALVGGVETVRHVHPDVAVVHAFGSVLMPWRAKLPRRRLSRQTLVALRTPDGLAVESLIVPRAVAGYQARSSTPVDMMASAAAVSGMPRRV